MVPADVVRRAATYLDRHRVASPLPTAETLLASVLGISRVDLYARAEGLSSAEARTFGRALCRRCTGTPLQHLTGEEGFRRLTLRVRPGVFVPRPETEIVVEHALATIEGIAEPLIVDVGTGTGAIALAIADEHPGARVVATDLAPEAVDLARENAAGRAGVSVVHGDLLDGVHPSLRGLVDLVVSNPPYIEASELPSLPAEVLEDPRLALIGGIQIYRRLLHAAVGWLGPGGAVVIEIGETQAAAVSAAAGEAGLGSVVVHPDLVGRDRVVVARRR
jgi:release factor glutamine methyltransferase